MDNQHKKIAGYRDLSEDEIALMNDLKAHEENLGIVLGLLSEHCGVVGDSEAMRWVSLARTHLETGMMFAIKAVARPTNGLGRKGG